MQHDNRPRQHAQQRERAHADRLAEQRVEAGHRAGRRTDRGGAHPAPSRIRLRKTSTRGGSALCQEVTVASR